MNELLTFLPSGVENSFLLVIALSIDVFFTGFSYGGSKIHIPAISAIIISGISVIFLGISLIFGQLTASLFASIASFLGGCILLCLGIFRLKKSIFLANQIHQADSDHNGILSAKESFILGFALALDCIAAGVGAGTAFYPLLPCCLFSFIGCLFALYIGLFCGKWLTRIGKWNFSCLGGIILIFLALHQLLF